ncbi:MAG TPA: hypothetical protein VK509_10540 [Polyangiales bacterium]|nr:hypothetical protein [Polyangiales bacterium]
MAADGGVNEPVCDGDAAPGTQPASCLKDLECGPGKLCMQQLCTPCDKNEPVCPRCEPGSVATTSAVNGCSVCSCVAQGCKTHTDCPSDSVCENNQCIPCAASSATTCPAACPWLFKAQPFKHNGCALCACAPVSACQSDADCGTGLQCYRGAQCQDGCSDPSCCAGNFCSLPGCEDPPALSCSVVGCATGSCVGDGACAPPACKCDGATFQCSGDCAAVCKP